MSNQTRSSHTVKNYHFFIERVLWLHFGSSFFIFFYKARNLSDHVTACGTASSFSNPQQPVEFSIPTFSAPSIWPDIMGFPRNFSGLFNELNHKSFLFSRTLKNICPLFRGIHSLADTCLLLHKIQTHLTFFLFF